jgi:AcrR family transcriptional regulator
LTTAKYHNKINSRPTSRFVGRLEILDKSLKKDLIADAALACFLSSGYNGTTMDDIVKASGISKGGIYWHFKSKDEIVLYIIEKCFNEWNRELINRLNSDDSAKEALGKIVDYFLEVIVAPVLSFAHEFLLIIKDKEIFERACAYINNANNSHIVSNIIQAGVAKGEFKEIDTKTAANVFKGILDGISFQWFTQYDDRKELERTAKTALDIFLHGISNK